MEQSGNSARLQVFDQALAQLERRQQQIEHVVCLPAVWRDDRQPHGVLGGPVGKFGVIELPNRTPPLLNALSRGKLCIQVSSQDFGWKITRAEVHPRVFIHLPPEEAAAIGALFPQDLGALDTAGIVEDQSAAFTAGEVLRFMKAQGSEASESSQRFPPIASHQTMCIVLDHRDSMARRDPKNGLHFTRYAGIMDHTNRTGARRNQ